MKKLTMKPDAMPTTTRPMANCALVVDVEINAAPTIKAVFIMIIASLRPNRSAIGPDKNAPTRPPTANIPVAAPLITNQPMIYVLGILTYHTQSLIGIQRGNAADGSGSQVRT